MNVASLLTQESWPALAVYPILASHLSSCVLAVQDLVPHLHHIIVYQSSAEEGYVGLVRFHEVFPARGFAITKWH